MSIKTVLIFLLTLGNGTFSVIKYGERKAFKLACQVRQKHSGVLIIVDRNALPCLPDVEYIIRGKQ